MPTQDQQSPDQLPPSEDETNSVAEAADAVSEALDPPSADDIAAELGTERTEEGDEAESALAEPIAFRDLSSEELQSAVETLLFMNHKPLSLNRMRELINPEIEEDAYRTAISNIMGACFDDNRGVELVEVANAFQFRTKPVNKDILRRMYQITPMKLTNAMLEVLAIVAYNQPATREVVDKVRGVDSSHLLRVLLDKKMLRIAGKSDEVGHPMIYATTKEFLEVFGLRDLGALPSLREIEDMLPSNEVGQSAVTEEDMLAREMEGIADSTAPLEFNDLELSEFEDETPKESEINEASPAHGHSGPTLDASPESEPSRIETSNDLDLATEALRRLPTGPKGNA